MSADGDVRMRDLAPVGIDPGEQVLAAVPADAGPLAALPPGAFDTLLIVSGTSPDVVDRALVDRGVDRSRVGLIPVSDVPVTYDGPVWTDEAVAPADLTGLSMACARAMGALPGGSSLIAMDCVGLLGLFAETDRLVPFVEHVAGNARDRGIAGVYAVVRDGLDDDLYERVREHLDREVDLRGT